MCADVTNTIGTCACTAGYKKTGSSCVEGIIGGEEVDIIA